MSNTQFSPERFYKVPVVGIIRNLTFEEIKAILPVYAAAGLTTLEITMNTPSAKEIIRYASDNYGDKLNIGAGTVCNLDDLGNAFSAGAGFIVTPILDEEVIAECAKLKIPVFPGAFTPTEIYKAWTLGAFIVKIFPASFFGADYIKEIKAPLNNIRLMPTGGINIDTIESFIRAGSDGYGIGSQLFDKELIKNKDWNGLKKHFEKFVKYFIVK